jgi:hypothetical protein
MTSTLTEKLGNAAILEKDVFHYLGTDFVFASVKAYVQVAQRVADKGHSVKATMPSVFLDLAKAVSKSKILPDRDTD